MVDLSTLLIIAVICILIGAAIGSLVASLRGSKETLVIPQDGQVISEPEVGTDLLHVWRAPGSGQLLVSVEGRKPVALTSLSELERGRLMNVLGEVARPLRAAAAEPAAADRPGPEMPASDKPSPVLQPKGPARPPQAPVDPPRPARLGPIDLVARAVRADVPPTGPVSKSIAAQVDEILQEKLEKSQFKERAIRLLELPGKGMVVLVGLDQYDGVDAVPDPEIRGLIRESVAEWERRVAGE